MAIDNSGGKGRNLVRDEPDWSCTVWGVKKQGMEHEKYMREALAEGRAALAAGEFPVGCVLVADGKVLARGHRENSRGRSRNEIDHAEVVTLRRLLTESPDIDPTMLVAYSVMEPCLMCYATLLLSGIRHIVYGYEDVMGGGTNLPLYQMNPLYAKMEVRVDSGVCRDACLALFQRFFRNHDYLADTLLARYTLAQPGPEDRI